MHVNPKKQLAGSQTETLQSLPGVWCPVGLLEQLFGTCTNLTHTDENPGYINFDVWNSTLAHMLFQAGLANPNSCEGSKW